MCGEIVGEVDEYELYKYIAEYGIEELKTYLCDNAESPELSSCIDEQKSQREEL